MRRALKIENTAHLADGLGAAVEGGLQLAGGAKAVEAVW